MARKMKKVSRMNEFFIFNESGDQIEGVLQGIRTINTEFGSCEVADIALENGETKSIIISAGMPCLDDYVNCYIQVVYLGEERNPRTKRRFKAFDVFVDEKDLAQTAKETF
ncbi:MAG TPA: hypothetical protein EYP19_16390 [Desulfobacterales bacterium]|nr:hypothetical protein [Desulfobacterales bacterium]